MHIGTSLLSAAAEAGSAEAVGLTVEAFIATVAYSLLGIVLLVATVVAVNMIFGLNVKKELIHDNNIAVGMMVAGLSVSIAIIIAGTIGG